MWLPEKRFHFRIGLNLKELDFGTVRENQAYYWSSCREFFHPRTQSLPEGMLFVVSEDQQENVAAFLNKVEQKLEISERRQSRFARTNRNGILWIYPSRWWLKYSLRRSLLTVLLRAGVCYRPETNNFQETLNKSQYLKDTPYAIKRFLQGYTKCTSRITGWLDTFYWGGASHRFSNTPSAKQIQELLVKP